MRKSSVLEKAGARPGIALALGAVLLLAACRAQRLESVGTRAQPGEALQGRLVEPRREQSFTIEGVESSLLDFSIVSDRKDLAAPQVLMRDPSGQPVDLAPSYRTPQGAATVQVSGVVLLQTGLYQVVVRPTIPSEPVYYQFQHTLRFPAIEGQVATFTSAKTRPIYVSAPQGGLVTVRIRPARGSQLAPDLRGVEDPWGGRALDPSRRPAGCPPAQVARGDDGSVVLNFPAPISGRYVILAAAEPGREGAGVIDTRVQPKPVAAKVIRHPNTPPIDYGVPVSGSASDDLPPR